MNRSRKVSLFALGAALLASGSAHAAAFYLQEQSSAQLGSAFAGAQANPLDASTIFYNPAGLTELSPDFQMSVGGTLFAPKAKATNTGSTARGAAVTGGSSSNPFDPAVSPNAYIAFPLTKDGKWRGGLGISVPFGLSNKYDSGWFGRYDSTSSMLKVVDVAPTVSYKATDWLSLGFGLDIQYAEADLAAALVNVLGPNPATDGKTDLSGSGMTAGFNAGVLVKPWTGGKVGLEYREGTSNTLSGRLITNLPTSLGGTVSRTRATAELDLPTIVSGGISQKVTKDLTLLGSVMFYKWSNFNDIPVTSLANTGISDSIQNYKNTLGFSVGGEYALNPDWTLKAGFQYDPTPTVDAYRTTRVPDGDRKWFTLGAGYKLNDRLDLNVGAAYIDVSSEKLHRDETTATGPTQLRATTSGSVGLFTTGVSYKF